MLKQAFNLITLFSGTLGGATAYHLAGGTAASTNATLISTGAHTLLGGMVVNTTTTLGYLRFYDLAIAPTPSSATGALWSIPIPASVAGAPGAGILITPGTYGLSFTNGLGFCFTGGGSDTDNTNGPAGVFISLSYK